MLNLQLVQQNCPFRFMWSSGALKRRVCEVVEGFDGRLYSCFTSPAHVLITYLPNRTTKWLSQCGQTRLALCFCTWIPSIARIGADIGFVRDCKKYTSCCLPLSFHSSASFFISFNSTLYHLRTIIISFIMPINPFVCLTED